MTADRRGHRAVDQHAITRDAAKRSRSEREADRAAGDFRRAKDTGKLTMQVRVYSPFRDYYDGTAFSISAVNATGPFDVLPRHHSFISLLSAGELVIRPGTGGEQKVVISGGIMHVKADQVIVFLDV
jgi:hypothetical protein